MPVIIVTHDNRVFHFGDVIARMDDGHLVDIREQTPALVAAHSASDPSQEAAA
ncbi:MAG: hypothetical protein U0794_14050 [Isosphaeraceae bacterium]